MWKVISHLALYSFVSSRPEGTMKDEGFMKLYERLKNRSFVYHGSPLNNRLPPRIPDT